MENLRTEASFWVQRICIKGHQKPKCCHGDRKKKGEHFCHLNTNNTYLSSQAEDLLHQLLSLRRLLKEELDDGGQQSELDLQTETDWKRSLRPLGLLTNKNRMETDKLSADILSTTRLTRSVFVCDPTWVLSSWKPSRKLSSSSSALSILSAYSPTIQIMAARASGSSKESRFSHRVAMMLSYLRNINGLALGQDVQQLTASIKAEN